MQDAIALVESVAAALGLFIAFMMWVAPANNPSASKWLFVALIGAGVILVACETYFKLLGVR